MISTRKKTQKQKNRSSLSRKQRRSKLLSPAYCSHSFYLRCGGQFPFSPKSVQKNWIHLYKLCVKKQTR